MSALWLYRYCTAIDLHIERDTDYVLLHLYLHHFGL